MIQAWVIINQTRKSTLEMSKSHFHASLRPLLPLSKRRRRTWNVELVLRNATLKNDAEVKSPRDPLSRRQSLQGWCTQFLFSCMW